MHVNVPTEEMTSRTEVATSVNAETKTRVHSEARTKAGTRISQTSVVKRLRGSNRLVGTTKDLTVGGTTTEWDANN